MDINIKALTADLGTPTDIRIERDGDLDVAFTGWPIGTGAHGAGGNAGTDGWTRGTEVTVYLATTGQIAIHVRQWTRWQGEHDRNRAGVANTAAKALAWLREDAGGSLGPASKQAWEEACSNLPQLEGADVQRLVAPDPTVADLRRMLTQVGAWGIHADVIRGLQTTAIVSPAGDPVGCSCDPELGCIGCVDVPIAVEFGDVEILGTAALARDPINGVWCPKGDSADKWLSGDLCWLVTLIGSSLGEQVIAEASDAAETGAYPAGSE